MDLWNNPMVNNAMRNMSQEDLENFKKIGEQMYGNINFTDGTIKNKVPPPMEEAVAYVEEGIKSGILPEDLEEDEVHLLEDAYGKEWYLRYGWKRDEVPEPGLSLKDKKKINDMIEKANKKKQE